MFLIFTVSGFWPDLKIQWSRHIERDRQIDREAIYTYIYQDVSVWDVFEDQIRNDSVANQQNDSNRQIFNDFLPFFSKKR